MLPGVCHSAAQRRAALLLEVVLALAILVSSLAALGAQLTQGLRMTQQADERTRASALVDRMLTMLEFDPRMEEVILQEELHDGDFGEQHRGWFWELEFEPIEEVPGLGRIRLRILHQPDPEREDDIVGAQVMREVVLLKAQRGEIDLVEDFGMAEEQVEQLSELMPTGDFDPRALDPQELMELLTQDPETFLAMIQPLLPLLQQYFGEVPGLEELAGGLTSPDDLRDQLDRLRDELGGGGAGDDGEQDELDEAGGDAAGVGGIGGEAPRRGRWHMVPGRQRQPVDQRPGVRPLTPDSGGRGRGEQPQYTIEDLMRLREELQSQEGGR